MFNVIEFSFWHIFFFQACDVRGAVNSITTAYSKDDETCKCKEFVAGEFCNECKEGYWNLTQKNPDGCQSK